MPPTPEPPPTRSPLLQRLDAITDLAHHCNGLLLNPDGKLTRTDSAAVAQAIGIAPGRDGAAVELLLLLGIAVGVLRADGLRVRAAPLHDAWRQLDDTLRAGLLFAAWCHRVAWPRALGDAEVGARLQARRVRTLHLLYDLPAGVDVPVGALVATVADHAGLRNGPAVLRCVLAAFLDPLVALGHARVDPPPPAPAVRLRLDAGARVVVGAALVAAGEPATLRGSEAN